MHETIAIVSRRQGSSVVLESWSQGLSNWKARCTLNM